MKNQVILGDCLIEMQKIPDKSIDMILTSPPYDNLRDYLLDKFVVWGDNVSHETKQTVIQELRQNNIEPVSVLKRGMVEGEIC